MPTQCLQIWKEKWWNDILINANKFITNYAFENLPFTLPVEWNNSPLKEKKNVNETTSYLFISFIFWWLLFLRRVLNSVHNPVCVLLRRINNSFVKRQFFGQTYDILGEIADFSPIIEGHRHRKIIFIFIKTWRKTLRTHYTSLHSNLKIETYFLLLIIKIFWCVRIHLISL